jgi:hypothetical protein
MVSRLLPAQNVSKRIASMTSARLDQRRPLAPDQTVGTIAREQSRGKWFMRVLSPWRWFGHQEGRNFVQLANPDDPFLRSVVRHWRITGLTISQARLPGPRVEELPISEMRA